MHRRIFLFGAGATALTACSAEPVWAPDDAVMNAFAPGIGAPYITLYTMKNTGSGNGAHTSLLINGRQRLMWDPAGNFEASSVPERNDVLFGITPRVEGYYVSYHARVSYYVIGQKLFVPSDVAERLSQQILSYGAVPKANCTRATSAILRSEPMFDSLPRTWFPNNLSDAFAKLPGVTEQEFRETDAADKSIAAREIEQALRDGPSQ